MILEELKDLLKEDEIFLDKNGKLLKNKIIEYALKLDEKLIRLLLKNDKVKKHFFKEIDGILIFDKEKFMKFIDNKEFLPNSYTTFKNKIGLANEEGKYLAQSKEIVLVWPYKDCVLEGGQEKPDEKRKEIFHNVILAPDEIDRLLEPKVFTNFKRIDKDGEHLLEGFKRDHKINKERGLPEDTITDNLIIKGNNLLVLYSLLKEFRGKVKLIYIDPPYNTGNDEFHYNDNFKHSTWLTFMKNRLEVARELLKEDGVIFVQIDSNERDYLKVMMDEIFGRQNYLNNIVVRKKQAAGVGQDAFFLDTVEYILIYAKQKEKFIKIKEKQYIELEFDDDLIEDYSNYLETFDKKVFVKSISDARGNEVKIYKLVNAQVKKTKEGDKNKEFYLKNFDKFFVTYNPQSSLMKKVIKNLDDKDFYEIEYIPTRGNDTGNVVNVNFYKKRIVQWLKDIAYIKDNEIIKKQVSEVLWIDLSWDSVGLEGDVSLNFGKKPESLIKRIIESSTKKNDIVLDFFMGSGATCAVAHKMGRQYIGVEQLDYGRNSAVVRLKNVINADQTGISKDVGWKGGGDFVYMELLKLNENFIEKIYSTKNSEEILKIWEEIKLNGFLSYKINQKLFDSKNEDFKTLSIEDQKRILLETLDYNYLYVNYSEIEDGIYKIEEKTKSLNKNFYGERLNE